jgi:hypothetical protein
MNLYHIVAVCNGEILYHRYNSNYPDDAIYLFEENIGRNTPYILHCCTVSEAHAIKNLMMLGFKK